jgi:hypothetical protein
MLVPAFLAAYFPPAMAARLVFSVQGWQGLPCRAAAEVATSVKCVQHCTSQQCLLFMSLLHARHHADVKLLPVQAAS